MGVYTAVWPLESGIVNGVNPLTDEPVELIPFVKGWMTHAAAAIAEGLGSVQIMVGETPESLMHIPVCANATIFKETPDTVTLVFQEPVNLADVTGFSVSGSVGATTVIGENASGKELALLLGGDVLATEALEVTYSYLLTSMLGHEELQSLLVVDFVIVANFI